MMQLKSIFLLDVRLIILGLVYIYTCTGPNMDSGIDK